jgi:hypothetical protein
LETKLSQVITILLNSYSLLDSDNQQATTSLVALLMARHICKANKITDILKCDTKEYSGKVLEITTIVFRKMLSEGGMKMKGLIKLLNESGLLGKYVRIILLFD